MAFKSPPPPLQKANFLGKYWQSGRLNFEYTIESAGLCTVYTYICTLQGTDLTLEYDRCKITDFLWHKLYKSVNVYEVKSYAEKWK
jgi:hypothetical protein